jgi:hypothetical protein
MLIYFSDLHYCPMSQSENWYKSWSLPRVLERLTVSPLQMAFSCSHFSKLVAEEDSSAEICRLPLNLFEDLLAAEQLQAISEIEVAQVCELQPKGLPTHYRTQHIATQCQWHVCLSGLTMHTEVSHTMM